MVQNFSIEEVCNKTFAYSYSGIPQSIQRTLRSQLSKWYASPDEFTILFFCYSLVTLLFAVVVVV